jgi:hypothetical protein
LISKAGRPSLLVKILERVVAEFFAPANYLIPYSWRLILIGGCALRKIVLIKLIINPYASLYVHEFVSDQ